MTTKLVTKRVASDARIDALADAGLVSVCISIAAPTDCRSTPRGIDYNERFSRLQKFPAIPEGVTFSYRLTNLALSYPAYSDPNLVTYSRDELHETFDQVKALEKG